MRARTGVIVVLGALVPAGTASAARPRPLVSTTIEWVGDIALSSQRGLPPGGLAGPLAPLAGTLRNAEITAGNLEGTLSSGGASKCAGAAGSGTCFAFQAPPWIAGQLRGLGFDLLNQANNHSMDFGPSGRIQTFAALRRAGLAATGMPGQVTVLTVPAHRLRGHRTRPPRARRVAFVGFAPYAYDANLLDIAGARRLVRRARRIASLVVVIIHAGAEGAGALHTPQHSESFLGENRGDPRAFAHAVIDAGASLVLGSGPHVIRGIERYRGRLIAYSLGNFIGYHTLAGGGVLSQSAILRVTLGPNGRVLAGRWIPVTLSDGIPRRDASGSSLRLVRRLSREDFREHWTIGRGGWLRIGRRRR